MALFVGKVAHEVTQNDLEDLFGQYGKLSRCDIKKGFAFVTFENREDSEEAMRQLQGKELFDSSLFIEPAKERKTDRDGCFRCHQPGHWARDCPNAGAGGRGYSPRRRRDYSPRRRDHGRDPYDRHDYGGRPDYDRRYGGSYRGSGRRDDYDRRDDYRRSPARDDRSYSPRRGSPPRHRDSPPSRRDSPPYENKRSPSPSPTRE